MDGFKLDYDSYSMNHIASADPKKISGNFGTLDQIQAIEFLRSNWLFMYQSWGSK